ncbi:MAG: sigma-70 family RNA polymerase sigma factor [Deltaproteobacteria bacterium]|nr:sigma-70 family RNA polymerase sigma factor [Deltaproteobacteria bacterium]
MNHQEFTLQVVSLKNKLFRFANRILDHTEEAEDVVQEVFIKLWIRREKLAEYRSVEALAMITTKNMCLDRIRTKKYPVDPMDNHRRFLENLPAEQKRDYSEEISKVKSAMKILPRQQQMIMQLRDIDGYDFESIAEIMEMNENAIRVSLSRARKRIRELITTTKTYDYQRN